MTLRPRHLLLSAVLSVCVGCSTSGSGDGNVAVPRRRAYPRIVLPDSVYTVRKDLPMNMQVNSGAEAVLKRDDSGTAWVTVTYPSLGAELYFTFTVVDPSTVDAVLDNRVERMALNLGGNSAEMTDFATPAGLSAKIVSGSSVTTPVQFLATDSRSVVVSGSAYLAALTAATRDSLAPVIAILRRDIIHTISTLGQ